MEILIKHKAIEDTLKEIADLWHEHFPKECELMARIVDEESKNLIKSSGLSEGGTLLTYCKLTPRLYAFIKRTMRRLYGIDEFFSDERNYRLLVRVWSDLKVRTKPTQYFHVPV